MRVELSAVVLAGAGKPDALCQEAGVESKALLPLHGRPMAAYVLEALSRSSCVRSIAVIGSDALASAGWDVVPSTRSLIENLVAGFEHLGCPPRLLVLSCDVPLLRPEMVEDFATAPRVEGADLAYPIVRREVCERSFPSGKRTYVKLREGTYTGGNLMVLSGNFISKQKETIRFVYDARKKPLRLCRLLGFGFVLKLLAGRLTLPEIEQRISSLFHCTAAAVESSYPEVAFDVDKPEDLALVRERLKEAG